MRLFSLTIIVFSTLIFANPIPQDFYNLDDNSIDIATQANSIFASNPDCLSETTTDDLSNNNDTPIQKRKTKDYCPTTTIDVPHSTVHSSPGEENKKPTTGGSEFCTDPKFTFYLSCGG